MPDTVHSLSTSGLTPKKQIQCWTDALTDLCGQFDVDPQPSMRVFPSWEVATKENKFSGRNTTRWHNEEFDRLYKSAETEMDPVKRAAMFIKMNDLVVQNMVVIPLVWRNWVSGVGNKLKGTDISGWDSSFYNLANWYREA